MEKAITMTHLAEQEVDQGNLGGVVYPLVLTTMALENSHS